jgi:hypothetical protein
MKAFGCAVLFPLLAACASGAQNVPSATSAAQVPSANTPHARVERGDTTLDRISSKDFAGAREWFNATMREQLPVSTIRSSWSQCESALGGYKSRAFNGATRVQGYAALEYDVVFEKGHAVARVVFDDAGEVAGLFLQGCGM